MACRAASPPCEGIVFSRSCYAVQVVNPSSSGRRGDQICRLLLLLHLLRGRLDGVFLLGLVCLRLEFIEHLERAIEVFLILAACPYRLTQSFEALPQVAAERCVFP